MIYSDCQKYVPFTAVLTALTNGSKRNIFLTTAILQCGKQEGDKGGTVGISL